MGSPKINWKGFMEEEDSSPTKKISWKGFMDTPSPRAEPEREKSKGTRITEELIRQRTPYATKEELSRKVEVPDTEGMSFWQKLKAGEKYQRGLEAKADQNAGAVTNEAYSRGISSIANPIVGAMNNDPEGAFDKFVQGLTGEERAQTGDIIRKLGYDDEKLSPLAVELMAGTGGVIMDSLIMGGIGKGGKGIISKATKKGKLIKKIGKYEAYQKTLPEHRATIKGKELRQSSKATQAQIKQESKAVLDTIKKNKAQLLDDMNTESSKQLPKIKKSVQDFSKATGDTYKAGIDNFSKKAGNIPNDHILNFRKAFRKAASETDLTKTSEYTKIMKFFRDVSKRKNISFKQLNGMRKELLKRVTRNGQPVQRNEALYNMLDKEFSKFSQNYGDDFVNLQKEMSPVLRAKKVLGKWTKPNADGGDKIQRLLIKDAKGKALSSDESYVMRELKKIAKDNDLGMDDIKRAYASEIAKPGSVKTSTQAKIAMEQSKLQRNINRLEKIKSKSKFQRSELATMKAQLKELKVKSGTIKKIVGAGLAYVGYRLFNKVINKKIDKGIDSAMEVVDN